MELGTMPREVIMNNYGCYTTDLGLYESCPSPTQFWQVLRRDNDLAVRYLVSTLDDLPKGSLERPSDISLEVNWVVHCIAGTVKIQNGQTLGHIRESIDGRWLAQAYSPPTNSIVAQDQMKRCHEELAVEAHE